MPIAQETTFLGQNNKLEPLFLPAGVAVLSLNQKPSQKGDLRPWREPLAIAGPVVPSGRPVEPEAVVRPSDPEHEPDRRASCLSRWVATMNDIDPQEFGRLEAKVEAMEKTIEKMSRDLDQLVALANQGRGAFWIAMVLGGSIGAIGSAIVSKVINFAGFFK